MTVWLEYSIWHQYKVFSMTKYWIKNVGQTGYSFPFSYPSQKREEGKENEVSKPV